MTTARIALFSIDHALTDRQTAFELWAGEFAAEYADEVAANCPEIEPTWLRVADRACADRVEYFTLLRARYGLDRSVDHLHADYRRRLAELVPHRPEVTAALTDLQEAGWALGAITGGERATQIRKLHRAQLDHLVDAVITTGEPDLCSRVDLMRKAVKDLGAVPHADVWMVSDFATDVVGAQTAGLGSIWISRGRTLAPDDPQPDRVFETLVEAARWLAAARPM
ncbi:HAD family hydrolase [Streptomyces albidoflavus]|uniref:HAD family hydrolase n=1 Tax=Streptomyces albidoflavus TaxID=1886 RepID=UPI00344F027E